MALSGHLRPLSVRRTHWLAGSIPKLPCSSLLLRFVVVVLDRPIVDLRERPLGFVGFRIELVDAAFDPVPMAIEFVVFVPVAREWGVTAYQVEFHLHYGAS